MSAGKNLKMQIFSAIILSIGIIITAWTAMNYSQQNYLHQIDLSAAATGKDFEPQTSIQITIFYLVCAVWRLSMFFAGYRSFKSFLYDWKLDFPAKLTLLSIGIGLLAFSAGIRYYNYAFLLLALVLIMIYYLCIRFYKKNYAK
ncbi:MAG: hypothetical protein ACRC76_14180 [Proteocatella sp.]